MILDRLAREVEALIFASDEPLSISQLCEYTGSGEDSIHQALDRINRAFRDQHHALGIIEVAGGFRIATESEFGDVVSQLFEGKKPGKLSRAALETLAVVAYSQPCTRMSVESIRGVNCDSAIRTLLEREMIRISGRMETPGRPLLYSTTSAFLEYFGLSNLDHLPRYEEIEELLSLSSSEMEERDLFERPEDN
ncbi:MAG: SMC-Scp complex subunit ScpB [Candidatus Fermentibacteraceae bacterium]|nr:SMC-Scp complex subunit ScpB [Candidatus Fermentibacteraceae bacterium]